MKKFGLLGFPLGHSLSKKYFTEKFDTLNARNCVFDLFSFEKIEDFIERIATENTLVGFSVTIPHKENIIKFLDEIDDTAKKIGAVNCVKVEYRNGIRKLIGFNTDAFGFKKSIKPFLEPQHQRALIFGTGGASKAVYYVLKNIGLDVWFVSRDKTNFYSANCMNYEDINQNVLNAFKLIINTTPLGLFPNITTFPQIPYQFLHEEHFCYDLNYKPIETEFLKRARLEGAITMNGLDMLYAQADRAWEIWNL